MKHIEDKEIRGVSLKTVRWVVGSTILICMTVAGSTYSIKSAIKDLSNKNMLQDLKIKTNEVGISIIKTKLDNLQIQVNDIRIQQEKLKSQINNH